MDVLLLVLRALLAIALYAFLAAVLLMLWRDLRQATTDQSPQAAGRLVVLQTGVESLAEGDAVEFELTDGPKGPKAENVTRVEV